MKSKRIAIVLAIVFLVGLGVFTIYSRGYAERQKPFVQLISSELTSFIWSFETRGIVYEAIPPYDERFDRLVDIVIPEEAYITYVSNLPIANGWPVGISGLGVDLRGFFGEVVHRRDAAGDLRMTVGFNQPPWGWGYPGHEVLLLLEAESHEQPAIPSSAIHRCPFSNEYYIFTVSRRESAWGREFFVEREFVSFGFPREIGHLTTIRIEPGQPIVLWSDEPLHDGAVVRLFD